MVASCHCHNVLLEVQLCDQTRPFLRTFPDFKPLLSWTNVLQMRPRVREHVSSDQRCLFGGAIVPLKKQLRGQANAQTRCFKPFESDPNAKHTMLRG